MECQTPTGTGTRNWLAPFCSRKIGCPSESGCQFCPSAEPSTRTALMKLAAGVSSVTPSSGSASPVSRVMIVVPAPSETWKAFPGCVTFGEGTGRSIKYGSAFPSASVTRKSSSPGRAESRVSAGSANFWSPGAAASKCCLCCHSGGSAALRLEHKPSARTQSHLPMVIPLSFIVDPLFQRFFQP